MEACGSPHNQLKCLQIAGTNGKGSVAAMISKALENFGVKTGLFTSPHLTNINERIRINSIPIPTSEIEKFIIQYKDVINEIDASFFESITTLAFWYFCKCKVDFAVLETGLGGRFDSVTVCKPELTVMTPISYDHKEILGDTLEKITMEKTGILKDNIPLISAIQVPEVEKIIKVEAKKKNVIVTFCKTESSINLEYLKGVHQMENATLAVKAVTQLGFIDSDRNTVFQNIAKTKWYGRYQILRKDPLIVFDVCHNSLGIQAFLDEYSQEDIKGKKILIIAIQGRKDINSVVHAIEREFDIIICTQSNVRNFMPAAKLKKLFSNKKSKIANNPEFIIGNCTNSLETGDSLAIIGTHYLGKSIQSVYKILFDTL